MVARRLAIEPAVKVFLACCLLGSLTVFSTYAARLSVLEVTGAFGVDAVDVGISPVHSLDESIIEGDSTLLCFQVEAKGADCYVRCKSECLTPDSGRSGFGGGAWLASCAGCDLEAVDCGFDPDLWMLAEDGYAYCKSPIERNAAVGIRAMVESESGDSSDGIAHQLTVEAVQARHFTPDFSSGLPWGDLAVQDYNGQVVSYKQGDGLGDYAVEYGGDAEGLSVSDDNLFKHFPTMVPGDSCSGRVVVGNSGDKPVNVRFRIPSCSADGAQILLEQARLRVSLPDDLDGTILFEGSLGQASSGEGILLGLLEPGQSKGLEFSFSLPASLGNEAAASSGEVRFRFEAYEADGSAGAAGDSSADDSDSTGAMDGSGAVQGSAAMDTVVGGVKSALAQTGDFLTPIVPALLFVFAFSGLVSVGYWVCRKRRRVKGRAV